MPARMSLLTTATLVLWYAGPALASRLVVPDDVATVQMAVTAGVDTVVVKDGLEPERVVAPASVVLEPFRYDLPPGHQAYPAIRSLEITPLGGYSVGGALHVRGFRILGQLKFSTHNFTLGFENCRFDSALIMPQYPNGPQSFVLIGCQFTDTLAVRAGWVQMLGNTVIGAGMYIFADGNHDIRGNVVTRAPGTGIRFHQDGSIGEFSGNTVSDCGAGIALLNSPSKMRDNLIERCAGDGVFTPDYDSGLQTLTFTGNTIRSCGGRGLVVGNRWLGADISHNEIHDTGGAGIECSWNSLVMIADSNRVVDAHGDGIHAAKVERMRGNQVIRAGGQGIRLDLPSNPNVVTTIAHRVMEGNTCVSNGGAGLSVESVDGIPDTVQLNISAGNSAQGLAWSGEGSFTLACNDWFDNGGGPTLGVLPASSDLQVNPQFCDPGTDDYSLASSSPVLSAPGCGLIGALGEGCASALGVAPVTNELRATLRVHPVPAIGSIRFALPAGTGATRLEVFDVLGARRWSVQVDSGSRQFDWDLRAASGERLPAGVYFAKLAGRRDSARFVITH